MITVGVAFLALMLILPMAAGLIAVITGTDTQEVESTVVDIPTTTTVPTGLVDPGLEGAAIVGPTPCPATDGT